MRVVGKRIIEDVRLRGPSTAEIEASRDAARGAPRVIPKGVYRYRSHAEANTEMDRWIADGMARKALATRDGS